MVPEASPFPTREAALLLVLVLLVVGGKLWGAPEPSLLAWPGGEVWGHAWVQWWHGEALPAWPSGTSLALGAEPWPVIDPLPTALAGGMGRLLGYAAAWNFLQLGAVALAFLGGAVLARREGGSPLVGGVVLATGPIFLGSLASGLTEDAALGLLPLAWAALLGEGWRRAALGGLLLGLAAACGLYLGWMGGVVALGLGLAALARGGLRALPRWALAGALALALAAGVGAAHRERLAGEGHRGGQVVEQVEPLWRVNPWRGVDLASLVTPGTAHLRGDELVRLHPAYLGILPLILAFYGGRSRWWAVLLVSVAVSLGPSLRFAGQPLGVENPAALALAKLPLGGLFNHHGRLLLAGQVALAVLASRGSLRLVHRLVHREGLIGKGIRMPTIPIGAIPWILALGITTEIALISPAPLPLPLSPATVDPLWAELATGQGPVLPWPAGGPGVHFQRPLYEQRAHGRPLLIAPNRPGAGRGLTPEGLRGVGAIAARAPFDREVEARLGPPTYRSEAGAIWEFSP